MKTLNIYLQESLLDDFDDLEKSTDKRVEELSYIGGQYNVRYIEEEHSFLDTYIGKGNLKVTSISGSQLKELYRIFICNDDMYSQEVLSFFIKPIHK